MKMWIWFLHGFWGQGFYIITINYHLKPSGLFNAIHQLWIVWKVWFHEFKRWIHGLINLFVFLYFNLANSFRFTDFSPTNLYIRFLVVLSIKSSSTYQKSLKPRYEYSIARIPACIVELTRPMYVLTKHGQFDTCIVCYIWNETRQMIILW